MAFAAIMNARITKIQKGNIEAFLNWAELLSLD
jgi:hypothetical protein